MIFIETSPKLNNNSSSNPEVNDENSLNYQTETDKLIDTTRKIQLKERTNVQNLNSAETSLSMVDVGAPYFKEVKSAPTYI